MPLVIKLVIRKHDVRCGAKSDLPLHRNSQVTVTPDRWGAMLLGEFKTTVGFTDQAKKEVDAYKVKPEGNPVNTRSAVNGLGLLIMGKTDGSGTVRIIIIIIIVH